MRHYERYQPPRSSNKRVDDLRVAMSNSSGEQRNGNHRTVVNPGTPIPDVTLCHDCSRMLYCITKGVSLPDTPERPCTQVGLVFKFHYHDSCCLTFTTRPKQITDHGMWGYSVTTSRSIRWYLEALYYHHYLDSQETVNELCKTFKKRHDAPNGGDDWIAL